jgi:hypothetical protein
MIVWTVIAYFCYRFFGSELAGYIVGAVGAAATIATMFLTPTSAEPKPEAVITTAGSYSPGKVSGNYSVGPESPLPEPDAISANSPAPEKLTIQTKGDFSPGLVGRDYIITQTIVHQHQNAQKKIWRELAQAAFPLISDSEGCNNDLWNFLVQGAALTFRDKGFTRFIFVLHREEVLIDDLVRPVYTVLTNQPLFCATAHELYVDIFKNTMLWKESDRTPEGRDRIQQKHSAKLIGLEGWSKSANLTIRSGWNAIECKCDSDTKTCELSSCTKYSQDPADYDEHVRTTSEMLLYVASYFNAGVVSFAGDARWYANNYALMKLTIKTMDERSLKIQDIRFNTNDPEEWDYLNGAFDVEVSNFAKAEKP